MREREVPPEEVRERLRKHVEKTFGTFHTDHVTDRLIRTPECYAHWDAVGVKWADGHFYDLQGS